MEGRKKESRTFNNDINIDNESHSERSERDNPEIDGELVDMIKKQINTPRIEMLDQDEDFYHVKLGDEEFKIGKGESSEFIDRTPSGGMGMSQQLVQSLEVIPGLSIFQDESVKEEFKEIMMFHEISEIEHKRSGHKDAHQRAVHDEILYVLKYLDPQSQKEYFNWAKKVREEAKARGEVKVKEKEEEKMKEEEARVEEDERKKEIEKEIPELAKELVSKGRQMRPELPIFKDLDDKKATSMVVEYLKFKLKISDPSNISFLLQNISLVSMSNYYENTHKSKK
jgi:hypothetical protein